MKRILLFLLVVFAAVACKKESGDVDLGQDGKGQTTLIYFTGTSLKSYFNVNVSDAEIAIASGALGSGGKFLYLLPSSYSSATLYELSKNGDKCESREVKSYTDFNTLNSESVQQVIDDVKLDVGYDENKMQMNLVVSGHGTGWVPQDYPYLKSGSGEESSMWEKQDGALMTRFMGSSTDGYMDIEELRVGVENSGVKFGYILFDECFMSNIELLYRLRDCCDYIVASPCEIMAAGFPYEYVLPNLFTEDGYNFDLIAVCEAYNFYYTSVASYKYGCVAMCVTSELEELANIMGNMNFEDVNADTLQTYENLTDNVFYDLGQFVNVACAGDPNLDSFNEQFDKAFPEAGRLHTDQYYTALSNYGPQDIDYYSGVTTSDPSVKFREDWSVEPWTIASGRDISVD